jgi:hypothetical protein
MCHVVRMVCPAIRTFERAAAFLIPTARSRERPPLARLVVPAWVATGSAAGAGEAAAAVGASAIHPARKTNSARVDFIQPHVLR